MKKIDTRLLGIGFLVALVVSLSSLAVINMLSSKTESNVLAKKSSGCTTIQSGEIVNTVGDTITTGFDQWGYNYQANIFNGTYCGAYRDAAWCQPYKEDELIMKWNNAWLSNKDCDGDGLLDRHYGFSTYRGSGAWLTNHMAGYYPDENGDMKHWTYFVKIVAAPSDAELAGGVWYAADGTEIGPAIWGDFAIIEEVNNDTYAGFHGIQVRSPNAPGFGKY